MQRIPHLHVVVRRLLKHLGIDSRSTEYAVVKKLQQESTQREGIGEFVRWCRSIHAPCEIHNLDRLAYETLSWCGFSLDAARRREAELSFTNQFPNMFFILYSGGCYVPGHEVLDGLTSNVEAAIWNSLWPPNDWLCSCGIYQIDVNDPAVQSLIDSGKQQIITNQMLKICETWYRRSPRRALEQ